MTIKAFFPILKSTLNYLRKKGNPVMQEPTTTHSTFVLERSYPTTPERVFAAFADSGQKRRWFVEGHRNIVKRYELDFRAGGREQSEIVLGEGTPVAGKTCTNDTLYQDIVVNRRIVFSSSMTIADHCISVSLVTIELLPTASGTDLLCTHQGAFFEHSDGPERRQQGWSVLLDKLSEEFAH